MASSEHHLPLGNSPLGAVHEERQIFFNGPLGHFCRHPRKRHDLIFKQNYHNSGKYTCSKIWIIQNAPGVEIFKGFSRVAVWRFLYRCAKTVGPSPTSIRLWRASARCLYSSRIIEQRFGKTNLSSQYRRNNMCYGSLSL